ncbi:MAG TPA: AMP-binding protein [Smithellaceae bacterium]|nr:AMP-binding protein [Smithellaceae bacterium]
MSLKRLWHKSYASDVPAEIHLEKITFRQLEKLVNRFTRALIDIGVKEGDKVAMFLPNIPQMIIANHAAYRAGAVTAMNNPLYTERELTKRVLDENLNAPSLKSAMNLENRNQTIMVFSGEFFKMIQAFHKE